MTSRCPTVAIDRGASVPDTILVFAILVGVGVAAAGLALRAPPTAKRAATGRRAQTRRQP